jgi:hypothetical protein
MSDTTEAIELGPLPPHRKVTAHGRVWIEEDMRAYGRQERAAERMLWQSLAEENERLRAELAAERERMQDLAESSKEYAENAAISLEGCFGVGRTLDELIAAEDMPAVWRMSCDALGA